MVHVRQQNGLACTTRAPRRTCEGRQRVQQRRDRDRVLVRRAARAAADGAPAAGRLAQTKVARERTVVHHLPRPAQHKHSIHEVQFD